MLWLLVTADAAHEGPGSNWEETVKRKVEYPPKIDWGTEESDNFSETVEAAEETRKGFSTVGTIGEERHPGVPANRETPRPVHMAEGEGLEAGLFWFLLDQAGYQAW